VSAAPKTIADGVVVTFDYVIRDSDGETVDSSSADEPGLYLHGASNIAPGLEAALAGRRVGDSLTVEVPPEEGFGVHDGQEPITVPKDVFAPGVEITMGMQCTSEAGEDEPIALWVVGVTDAGVLLDRNHPLAGKTVIYDVTIAGLREATPAERAEGAPA